MQPNKQIRPRFTRRLKVAVFLAISIPLPLSAALPAWWSAARPEGGPVIDPAATDTRSTASANIGQAKYMAYCALQELEKLDYESARIIRSKLTDPQPDPANPTGPPLPRILTFYINSPPPGGWEDSQRKPLLIGQLKAIAAPFYEALELTVPDWLDKESVNVAERGQLQLNGTKDPDPAHPNHYFPWTASAADDNNRGIATIAQLKAVFALRFETHPALAQRERTMRLAGAMTEAVESRIIAANTAHGASAAPGISMPLFTGVPHQYTGSTFTPNSDCWIDDLRPQLTGFHMGAGAYTQSYGMMPLGGHYVLNCGHNGPEPLGFTVKYVSPTGVVFTTTATHWINDFVDEHGSRLSSDTKQPEHSNKDLMVYVLADPVPAWVNCAPILQVTNQELLWLQEAKPPTVSISQGNVQAYHPSPGAYPPDSWTPNNRKAYVKTLSLIPARTSLRDPYWHGLAVGDSGTPEYVLVDDTLYLYGVNVKAGGGAVLVGSHIPYINSLIARGAAVSGKPAITISAVTNPVP